jgi:uncharacterized membrane protein
MMRRHALWLLLVAVLVHLLAVWAAPRLIMRVVGNKMAVMTSTSDTGVLHAPQVTAQSRAIVMPSPDMLYSTCTFDVSKGPLRITANPQLSTYWSIALYAANSDNFYVRNDRQAQGKPVDLKIVSSSSALAGQPDTVVAPTDTGVVLMRVLTGNYETEKAVLEPARRTLQCTPFKAN